MGSILFSLEMRAAARALHEQWQLPLLSCASSVLVEGRTWGVSAVQPPPDVLVNLICNVTENWKITFNWPCNGQCVLSGASKGLGNESHQHKPWGFSSGAWGLPTASSEEDAPWQHHPRSPRGSSGPHLPESPQIAAQRLAHARSCRIAGSLSRTLPWLSIKLIRSRI